MMQLSYTSGLDPYSPPSYYNYTYPNSSEYYYYTALVGNIGTMSLKDNQITNVNYSPEGTPNFALRYAFHLNITSFVKIKIVDHWPIIG